MDIFSSLSSFTDIGLLVLRIVLCGIFLVHGVSKWPNWRTPEPGNAPNPMRPILCFLAVVEPLGAIGLLVGLLTPFAAIGLGFVMMGAIYFKITTWKTGFASQTTTGWEFDLLILASLFLLVLTGAGMYSLDALVFWR